MKDPFCAKLLDKKLTVDQIDDKESFLSSIKFFILNNDSIRSFVAERNISAAGLTDFKNLKAAELDEDKLKWMQSFIFQLFKEQKLATAGIEPMPAKKQIKFPFGKTVNHKATTDEVAEAVEQAVAFAGKFILPTNIEQFTTKINNPAEALADMAAFKQLVLNGSTTLALHLFDTATKFYKDNLANVRTADLVSTKFEDAELKASAKALKRVISIFSDLRGHSAEDYRNSFNDSSLRSLEKAMLVDGRVRAEDAAEAVVAAARAFGIEAPSAQKLLNMSTDKQHLILDAIITKFFKQLHLEKADSNVENAKVFISLVKKAYRTKMLFIKLNEIKQALDNV